MLALLKQLLEFTFQSVTLTLYVSKTKNNCKRGRGRSIEKINCDLRHSQFYYFIMFIPVRYTKAPLRMYDLDRVQHSLFSHLPMWYILRCIFHT